MQLGWISLAVEDVVYWSLDLTPDWYQDYAELKTNYNAVNLAVL